MVLWGLKNNFFQLKKIALQRVNILGPEPKAMLSSSLLKVYMIHDFMLFGHE
jgi:hypothetical protein